MRKRRETRYLLLAEKDDSDDESPEQWHKLQKRNCLIVFELVFQNATQTVGTKLALKPKLALKLLSGTRVHTFHLSLILFVVNIYLPSDVPLIRYAAMYRQQ